MNILIFYVSINVTLHVFEKLLFNFIQILYINLYLIYTLKNVGIVLNFKEQFSFVKTFVNELVKNIGQSRSASSRAAIRLATFL